MAATMTDELIGYVESDSTYRHRLKVGMVHSNGTVTALGTKHIYVLKWSDKWNEWCVVSEEPRGNGEWLHDWL